MVFAFVPAPGDWELALGHTTGFQNKPWSSSGHRYPRPPAPDLISHRQPHPGRSLQSRGISLHLLFVPLLFHISPSSTCCQERDGNNMP